VALTNIGYSQNWEHESQSTVQIQESQIKLMQVSIVSLDDGLLARSQYPEGPATGHLGTGFSWFPCV
jgi:hypothetical protein